MISMKKTVMGVALAMAFSAGAAQAAMNYTTGNNFTMTSATGGLTGGTNDVVFGWDGTLRTSVVTDGTSNASLSSLSAFSGKIWTAHNVNIYTTGTYVFDTSCPTGDPSCGTGTAAQKYTLVVGAGEIGAHMLFDWSTSANIDVVQLYKVSPTGNAWSSLYSGIATSGGSPFKTGGCSAAQALLVPQCNATTGNTSATLWNLLSKDTGIDADNYAGTKMIDGPFVGQSANFNLKTVPVPAAAWLLGSGLLGLVGVARRKAA